MMWTLRAAFVASSLALVASCGYAEPKMATASESSSSSAFVDLKATCGARGDGEADDSLALKSCINRVNESYRAQRPVTLHIPPGIYHISGKNGRMPSFATTVPGTVLGSGVDQTYIVLDGTYAGPVFTWSEAWEGVNNQIWRAGTFDPARNRTGPTIENLTLSGSRSAGAEQDGLAFLDHNDHVVVENVNMVDLPGAAILVGQATGKSSAYMRESSFRHIKLWFCGDRTHAAVNFSSISPGTGDITIDDLQIYAFASSGITFTAPRADSVVTHFHVHELRVEAGEDRSATGNNINIGLPEDRGVIYGLVFEDLYSANPTEGHYGLYLSGGAQQEYGISISDAMIGSSFRTAGLYVGNVRQLTFIGGIAAAPSVTYGPSLGSDVFVQALDGSESTWTYMANPGTFSLANSTNDRVFGFGSNSERTGIVALQGLSARGVRTTLSFDGTAPSATNQFCPAYDTFNTSIQLVARGRRDPGDVYAWTMPIGILDNRGAIVWIPGSPTALGSGAAKEHQFKWAQTPQNAALRSPSYHLLSIMTTTTYLHASALQEPRDLEGSAAGNGCTKLPIIGSVQRSCRDVRVLPWSNQLIAQIFLQVFGTQCNC